MPTIENVSLASAEQDELMNDYYSTMKAKVKDMDKTGKNVTWRRHFRVAMCMTIG